MHVDIEDGLRPYKLEKLPRPCWPKGALTDSLATDVGKLVKKGIHGAFIYADLAKFLPFWCDVSGNKHESSDEDEEPSKAVRDLARALGGKEKTKVKLTMLQWQAAFDRYALAAAAAKQWDLHASMAHKDVVFQVAAQAPSKGRRQWLGIIYDELARRDWAERTFSGDSKLDVNVASLELCTKLLNKAELVFDQQAASNKGSHRAWDNGHAGRQWNQWGYKRQGDFAGASSSKRAR